MATTTSGKMNETQNRDRETGGTGANRGGRTDGGANRGNNEEQQQGQGQGQGQQGGGSLKAAFSEAVSSGDISQLRDRATEGFSTIRDSAGEYLGHAGEFVGQYSDDAVTYIRRYPVQSVLVGFGIGALVGLLLTPRR